MTARALQTWSWFTRAKPAIQKPGGLGRRRISGATLGLLAAAFFAGMTVLPVRGETLFEAQPRHGNGFGIFVDGRLACWLTLPVGARRGNVSFVLTKDQMSCSIAPSTHVQRTRRAVAALERRVRSQPRSNIGSKCFIFDHRQFCE